MCYKYDRRYSNDVKTISVLTKARHEKDMAAEEIRIPVLSLLKDGEVLFLNQHQYVAAMESVYDRSQDASINTSVENFTREIEYVENMSVENLGKVAATLRRMVMSKQGETHATMFKNPLFTPELLSILKWRKNELKQSMHRYITRLEKLRELQNTCFKSLALENSYRYNLNLLETSLEQNMESGHGNEVALTLIDKLKKDLTKQVDMHDRNMRKFSWACKQEIIHKEELYRSARQIQLIITEAIKFKLQSTLGLEAQEDVDYNLTSQCIYELISRTYTLDVRPFVENLNRKIQKPYTQKSLYNPKNARRIITASSKVINEKLAEQELGSMDRVGDSPGIADGIDRETIEHSVMKTMTQTKIKPKKKGLFASLKRKIGKQK